MSISTALPSGLAALAQGRYFEAVALLEEFCQSAPVDEQYLHAQMSLVTAYHYNNQTEKAIALCHELTTSDEPIVQAWAEHFLSTIAAAEVIQSVVTPVLAQATSIAGDTNSNVPLQKRTVQEFKDFCQHNLLGELKILEAKRQQSLVYIIFASVIALIVVLLSIQFFPYHSIDFSSKLSARLSLLFISIFLFILASCMWGWVLFYSSSTESYASGFKTKFIQKIIEFIDTNQTFSYSYNEDRHTTLIEFRLSQLFQGILAPNKITQTDCVSARIGKTDIFFSEICTEAELNHSWVRYLNGMQDIRLLWRNSSILLPIFILGLLIKLIKGIPYVVRRVIKGQRINYQHFEEEVVQNQVSRKKIFKGLFFRANFNKSFKGKTVVLPCDLTSKLQALNKGRGEVVKLEDPEFAKLFIVYGDQVESRYILSTSLIEKIVNFRKKAGRKIYISFRDSKIYIAIEYDEDIFEPRLFKTMLKFTPMREYFESLQLMLGIVEDLNLNRRIWS